MLLVAYSNADTQTNAWTSEKSHTNPQNTLKPTPTSHNLKKPAKMLQKTLLTPSIVLTLFKKTISNAAHSQIDDTNLSSIATSSSPPITQKPEKLTKSPEISCQKITKIDRTNAKTSAIV